MKLVRVEEFPSESLEIVKRKRGERWSIEFVQEAILDGRAAAYEAREGAKVIARMVVERYDQGEVWMNVWILHGEGLENAPAVLRLIDDLARSVGAATWRCAGRKGWKAIGLKPIAVIYERVLT